MRRLGMQIVLLILVALSVSACGMRASQMDQVPQIFEIRAVTVTGNEGVSRTVMRGVKRRLDQAIGGVDAVIMLRLQKERMASIELPDEAAYFAHYGLDRRRLGLAAPGCLVMHPGPINRGIEIASDVADGAQSRILEQVGNGVFVRMAVLSEVLAR